MLLSERISMKPGEISADILTSAYLSVQAWSLAKNHTTELVTANKDFVMLTGSSNIPLANTVGRLLEKKLYYSIDTYGDGCLTGHIPTTVSGKHVIIIQSTQSSIDGDPNVNMAELENMIYTAKVNMGASYVTVVDPSPSDMRQDRKTGSGVGIAAKLHADKLKHAGADRIVLLDLHAEQEQGFFDFPVDEIYGSHALLPYVLERVKEQNLDLKMGAPDNGAEKKSRAWAKRIDGRAKGEIVIFKKERDIQRKGKSQVIGVEGDMEGYDILLADDVYASGESLDNAATYAKTHGAKSVRAVVTHGEFLGRDGKTGVQILDESPLEEVFVTDSINLPEEIKNHPKVKVVSVASLLAEVIYRNLMNISLHDLVD